MKIAKQTNQLQRIPLKNASPKDKLILDLTYIEEYSFWLDIKLLFQTLIVLFKKDSTEAFHRESNLVFEEYQPLEETETQQTAPGSEEISDSE